MSNADLIRRAALRYLTRRDYSQQEIAQKLKTKGYDPTECAPVIAALIQSGLIDDRRFSENYVYWRRKKGYGPLRIAMELQARGIIAEVIAELLEITDNAWFTDARHAWKKHFKGRLPRDFTAKAKQIRFLQYRGFTREQIESVFIELKEELPEYVETSS